jgi:hypothetical protein
MTLADKLRLLANGHKFPAALVVAEAADALEAAEKALRCVTALLQAERDCLVECSTTPPAHDLATLDPLAREDVEEMDAALETARAALSKLRGTE